VVGVGGFLGIGQKDVAIPYDQVQWMTSQEAQAQSNQGGAGAGTTNTAGGVTTPGGPGGGAGGTTGSTASTAGGAWRCWWDCDRGRRWYRGWTCRRGCRDGRQRQHAGSCHGEDDES
jgi:hypothetical protein